MDPLRIVLTGATGMAGEGVLHECLKDPDVAEVLIINRRPSGISHPKLSEFILPDFFNLAALTPDLSRFNACFFCLGVSSVGMKEPEFSRLTYDLTIDFAHLLHRQNPNMGFCYISGGGTDSTEKGRIMWARVKGRTENELLGLFRNAWMFRPGYMQPTKGLKNTLRYYQYVRWMYPFLNRAFPRFVSTLADLGKAMLQAVKTAHPQRVLEVKDIRELSRQYSQG